MKNRFQPSGIGTRGGVFKCEICGRNTRRVEQVHDYCPECDEVGMIENSISDNEGIFSKEEIDQCEARILTLKTSAAKRGGDPVALGLKK